MAAAIALLSAACSGMGRLYTWLPVREPSYIDPSRHSGPKIYQGFAMRASEFQSTSDLQLQTEFPDYRTEKWSSTQQIASEDLCMLWYKDSTNPFCLSLCGHVARTDDMGCLSPPFDYQPFKIEPCFVPQRVSDPRAIEKSSSENKREGSVRNQPICNGYGVPLKDPRGALCWSIAHTIEHIELELYSVLGTE